MSNPLAIVDAFTGEIEGRKLRGNPAAVMLLRAEQTPNDSWLQNVAEEMNLSETSFLWPRAALGQYDLRWFTPGVEIALCGHATLAAAHFLWENGVSVAELHFHTQSGVLRAQKTDSGEISLDFPLVYCKTWPHSPPLLAALGLASRRAPFAISRAGDDLLVKTPPHTLETLAPDLVALRDFCANTRTRGVILTQKAPDHAPFHFESRFFAPAIGIAEDPVTGSAHCALAPFWAPRYPNQKRLIGRQLSRRGGLVGCELDTENERVRLFGHAQTALRGEFL